jgi:hypothetical protein
VAKVERTKMLQVADLAGDFKQIIVGQDKGFDFGVFPNLVGDVT